MHLRLELRDIPLFLSTVSLKEQTGYALNPMSYVWALIIGQNIMVLTSSVLIFLLSIIFPSFQLTGGEFVDDGVPF